MHIQNEIRVSIVCSGTHTTSKSSILVMMPKSKFSDGWKCTKTKSPTHRIYLITCNVNVNVRHIHTRMLGTAVVVCFCDGTSLTWPLWKSSPTYLYILIWKYAHMVSRVHRCAYSDETEKKRKQNKRRREINKNIITNSNNQISI